jgi:outer membrane autotransporter protein
MLTTSVNNLSLNIHKIANSRTSFANSSFAANKAKSAWMQVFGSSFNRGEDEGNLEYKSNQRGIIGGYDLDSNSESSSVNGIMFGLSSGDAKTTSESFNVDSTSVFIGAYKNFNLSRATILSATILGGYEQYETKRKLVDNLNGFQTAKSDFNNIFFSPSLALEHKIKLNNTVDIAPEARVVYTSSFFGNQKETGSTANLNTKSRNAQILNSRAGVKAVMNLDDYKIELGAGLDNRLIKEGDVRSSVDGASLKYNTNNDKNVTGRYFKFSVRSGELKGVSLLASFEKRYASGNEDETFGQFSASYRF